MNIDLKKNNFINFNIDLFEILKKNYENNSLSNSILIYGDKGIGKSIFIKYFIDNLFNDLEKNKDKIVSSKHLNLIFNNSHPNFYNIIKLYDDKTKKFKKNITIDQIRKLESFIYQSSLNKLPKIVLLDSADDLNINSSNAILKILEEPKKNVFFFLISHSKSKIIPTITSRCIKFKFNKPDFNNFKKILQVNDVQLDDDDDIKYLFNLSFGSPGTAIKINSTNTSFFFDEFIDICKENKSFNNNILQFTTELNKFDNDQFFICLSIIKYILSNLIKINLGINIKNDLSNKISKKLYEISNIIDIYSCFKGIDYLNLYEKDLSIFNLDKKFFIINLFSTISKNT